MRLTSIESRHAHDGPAPALAILRAVRRSQRLTTALVVAVALSAAPVALAGTNAAWLAAAPAAAALILLAARAAVGIELRLHRLTLIAAGDERLPLPGVAEVRQQLLAPAWRVRLAEGLEARARTTVGWRSLHPAARRPGRPAVMAAAAPDLEQLATLLRAFEPANARAIAACELLLVDGARSPLFGDDGAALRREASRIAWQLARAW